MTIQTQALPRLRGSVTNLSRVTRRVPGSVPTIFPVAGRRAEATVEILSSTPLRAGSTLANFFSSTANGIFATFAEGNFVKATFPISAQITSVTYRNQTGIAYAPTEVLIQYSKDGAAWVTALTYTDNGTTSLQTLTISTSESAQYWRMYQNTTTRQNTAGWEWHIRLFSMTGTYTG